MKAFCLFLGLLLASSLLARPVAAKSDVTGRILDAALGEALEFATVSAFDADEALISGASTDSTGRFSLSLPPGTYTFRFEFIGYTSRDTLLSLKRDLNFGDISLSSDAVALDGATVTAARSQLSLKLDKQIFDVGNDIVSQGGSANEVLENVPQVEVSPEGVVSLRGRQGVKVLINGKPSALADNNALAGIPAENIARVEVMTTPSSRYEASGSAGILNIILKDKTAENWGAQLSATVGYPADWRVNGSFSVSKKQWTYFGNAGLRLSNYRSVGFADRTSELPFGTELLREDLQQDRQDRAGNAFGGFDFRPSEKTTLSASYSYYHQTNDDLSNINYTYRDGSSELQRDWQQTYDYLEPENYHQVEVSWSQDLAQEGQKLFVLFQNDFWDNDEQEDIAIDERFPTEEEALRLRTRNLESSNDYLLQVDYEQPLGEYGKLELGLRGETRIISSDYLAENRVNGEYQVYRGFDNDLDYYEQIGAVYAQYAYEREKLGLQVGLRAEFTDVRVEDESPEADIRKQYNNLFPTATISYKVSDNFSTNLSYTSRIRRPGFWQINPFGGLEDPNGIGVGNPDIDPSFTDNVEWRAVYRNDKLSISPFASVYVIDGFFDQYVTQDSTGFVVQQVINLDRELITEAGFFMNYTPFEGYQLSAEGRIARFRQRGTFRGIDFGNAFDTGSFELSGRGKLPWKLQGQLTFQFWGGQRYKQFFRDPVHGINGGINRGFLEDRLRITLNVRNAFALRVYRGGSTLPSFTNQYNREWQGQRVSLTAAWDLGKQMRARRARGRIR